MNIHHWILLLLWTAYCVIHSVLANVQVKSYFERIMGDQYKYYRLFYSAFAAISLILLLWYHFSLKSSSLFHARVFQWTVGTLLLLPGLIVMIICIHKYFYFLSGIQALSKAKPPDVILQKNGLHAYVRHPLYSGTLMFVWGLFLLFPYLNNLIAALVIHIYVIIGIVLEERQLMLEFGEQYRRYRENVPGLIPFIKGRRRLKEKR